MSGSAYYWPRQDILEKDKTEDWMRKHLDYAEGLLKTGTDRKDRMTRLMNGYNGVSDPASIAWLTQRYGQVDKSPFIKYRLSRSKIDLLNGEWLARPLKQTVTTINSQALSDKMSRYNFIKGAMIARKELEEIKNIAGVDIMEGAQLPQDETEFAKMNFKEQYEDVMQIIVDKKVLDLDAKHKLSKAFLNLELTNHCGMQIELDEQGKIRIHNIDPRDAIFEAVEDDDYAEQSPIRGCRRSMPVHQILLRYNLTKDQRDQLENARTNYTRYVGDTGQGRGFMNYVNGELLCDVIHIEWDSVTKLYEKRVPKTATQKMLDPDGDYLSFPVDSDKYESNAKFYNDKAAKEGSEIVTKYLTDTYEATRIGGIIDVNMRKVPVKRSVDRPSEVLSSSYVFYVHGRVNGVTVSFQQLMENYSNLYDVTRYILNRELSKVKGKILAIDRAGVDRGTKIVDMLYRMVNDQVLEFDSSSTGNVSGRQLDPSVMFREIDLGLSSSFQQLLAFKQDIRNDIDMITGVSDNRMGFTAASSTATAQQSDISASRTITEALFYGFSGFTKRVLKAIVDKAAISYAFYQTEEAQQILGAERFAFLQNSIELAYRDYGVEIEDGNLYARLSEKIEGLMQVSLNAGEIRTMDAMNVLMAETLAQKRQFLVNGWETVTELANQQAQADREAQAQMQQQQQQTQLQLATENREDLQQAKLDEIQMKGQVQMQVDDNRAKNDLNITNMVNSHEINMSSPNEIMLE